MFVHVIDTNLVLVDDKPFKITPKLALAYVGFNTIYLNKPVSDDIFVHELVHVWQFQKFGSLYIYRALKAQLSKNTYDYGGPERILEVYHNQSEFTQFNFEQQAEIIQDFYRLKYSTSLLSDLESFRSYDYLYKQIG
jgi:hypothetical protein